MKKIASNRNYRIVKNADTRDRWATGADTAFKNYIEADTALRSLSRFLDGVTLNRYSTDAAATPIPTKGSEFLKLDWIMWSDLKNQLSNLAEDAANTYIAPEGTPLTEEESKIMQPR